MQYLVAAGPCPSSSPEPQIRLSPDEEGVVAAVKEIGLTVPLVVRLEGTNVELGKQIINDSGLNVIAANDLADGAAKIVAAVRAAAA